MTDDQHLQLNELLDEYAVGALDADERAAFEAHLATCADCQAELAEVREVLASMSGIVAQEPPETLRASVLSAIADLPQQDEAAHGRHAGHAAAETAETPSEAADADRTSGTAHGQHIRSLPAPREHDETTPVAAVSDNVVELRARADRASRASKFTGLVAAAAVVAALAMGAWAMQSRNDAQENLAETQKLTQILGAPDVDAKTGKFAKGGDGTLVTSASLDKAVLIGSDLPELASDKVYQAWTINGDDIVSAGTFSPSEDETVVSLPPAAVDAQIVAVTIEDKGGADQPTMNPIFAITKS